MKKLIPVLFLGFALLGAKLDLLVGQQVTEGKAQPEQSQIKDRVSLFYNDVLKNDRMAALELVAQDSKNLFLNSRYDGLTDFRIAGIDLELSGDRAVVHVVRVLRVPSFGQPLDIEVNETWQRSDGLWYLVLSPPSEMETPFGKMKFETDSKPSDSEAAAMKQKIEHTYKNVDPDQYIRALQKVVNPPVAPEAKPSDKQPQSQSAPATTTQSDKPKPPQP
jgi:hypothetical protein